MQRSPDWEWDTPEEIARRYGFIDVREEPSTLGLGTQDFNALMSTDPSLGDPHFQAAWSDVKKQLVAEGTTELTGAKLAMTNAFYGAIENGIGVKPAEAAAAAKKFVIIGQTVLGQVGVIQNLIASTQGKLTLAQEVQIGQQFVGSMIGIMAALAPATAGIGTIIVAAIMIAVEVMKAAGLLGSSETPAGGWLPNWVGGAQPMLTRPDFTVGGMGAWAATVTPGAANWRQFPKLKDWPGGGTGAGWNTPSNLGNWFSIPAASGDLRMGAGWWKDGFFGIRGPGQPQTYDSTQPAANVAWGGTRPIDVAFPDYGKLIDANNTGDNPFLVMDLLGIPHNGPTGSDFGSAYIAAWKANAEYALNGLKSKSSSEVLLNFLRVWNGTHATSGAGAAGQISATLPDSFLVRDAKNTLGASDFASNGGFHINLGPRMTPPDLIGDSTISGLAGARDTSQDATPEAQYRAQLAADAAQQAAAAAPLIPTPVKVIGGTAIVAGGAWLALGRPMTVAAAKAAAKALYRSVVHR
jgi:hypothetical protein